MKRFICLSLSVAGFLPIFSQTTAVPITTEKTTSLVFPFPVQHVDRGNKNVLVHLVKASENILLVKAGTKEMAETNLSVVTTDGSVYSFDISYEEKPAAFIHHVAVQARASLPTYASALLDNLRVVHGTKDKKWDMEINLRGIYIKDNVLYYQLGLENSSPIDYFLQSLRFYIRDKKQARRTASQEIEIKPLHISGNLVCVKGNSRSVVVVAVEQFTIPEAKYLQVACVEKNGGRNLKMKITNNKIMNAIQLPELR